MNPNSENILINLNTHPYCKKRCMFKQVRPNPETFKMSLLKLESGIQNQSRKFSSSLWVVAPPSQVNFEPCKRMSKANCILSKFLLFLATLAPLSHKHLTNLSKGNMKKFGSPLNKNHWHKFPAMFDRCWPNWLAWPSLLCGKRFWWYHPSSNPYQKKTKLFLTDCDVCVDYWFIYVLPNQDVYCQLGFVMFKWHCIHHGYPHKPPPEPKH